MIDDTNTEEVHGDSHPYQPRHLPDCTHEGRSPRHLPDCWGSVYLLAYSAVLLGTHPCAYSVIARIYLIVSDHSKFI